MPTGGVDVVAFFEAKGSGDVVFGEDVAEGTAVVLGRAFPLQAFYGVVGDEVDEGSDAFCSFSKDVRLFESIVNVFNEDILKGESLLLLGIPILECLEKLVDTPAIIDWHDFGSNFVGCSMQ